jgi:protein-tyrosine-phosphatase
MAEGLAHELLGSQTQVESAGTNAHRGSASSLAIEVMRSKFGIDISTHNSRNVKDVAIDDFDCVIAMDSTVADDLKIMYPDIDTKLISWDIDDPIGGGLEAYERSAREIHKRIMELSAHLKEKGR